MSPKIDENRHLIPQMIDTAHICGYNAMHIRAAMNRRGQWSTPIQGDGVGWPDLTLVKIEPPRRFITWEAKIPEGKYSPGQVEWGRILSGVPGHEHYSGYIEPEDFAKILLPSLDKPIDPLKRCFNILDQLERKNPGNEHLRTLRSWMEMVPGATP